jgi:hypothetical protein
VLSFIVKESIESNIVNTATSDSDLTNDVALPFLLQIFGGGGTKHSR